MKRKTIDSNSKILLLKYNYQYRQILSNLIQEKMWGWERNHKCGRRIWGKEALKINTVKKSQQTTLYRLLCNKFGTLDKMDASPR